MAFDFEGYYHINKISSIWLQIVYKHMQPQTFTTCSITHDDGVEVQTMYPVHKKLN